MLSTVGGVTFNQVIPPLIKYSGVVHLVSFFCYSGPVISISSRWFTRWLPPGWFRHTARLLIQASCVQNTELAMLHSCCFFSFLQLHGDMDDLEAALGGSNSSSHSHSKRVTGSGSCSALVKLLPDMADLLIGHNTWTSYINMIRIFKLYDFKYQFSSNDPTVVPGFAQAFPSYPGRLYSGDDFYLISSGLVSTSREEIIELT